MYIKLLGKDVIGRLPMDCTIGKVYEVVGYDDDGDLFFIDDVGEKDFAYTPQDLLLSTGNWQVVDKNGEPV